MPGLLVFSTAVLLAFLSYASASVKVSHGEDIAATGQTFRVICTIKGETFDGWYGPNGPKIPVDSSKRVHVEIKGSTEATLVISNPVNDDGGDYKCKGSKSSDTYKLYVLSVHVPDTNQILQLGKTGVIVIQVHGYPKPDVVWKKDEQTIDVKGRFNLKDDGSLEIQNVQPSDEGSYTCIVSILNRRKEQTVKIEVKVYETAKITKTSKKQRTATEGYNITFLCEATGYPAPRYTWSSPGNPDIKTFDRFHVGKDTLTITNVQPGDKGKYTCEVTSGDGITVSATSEIVDVFVKPEVETTPSDKSTIVSLGDKVTLRCVANKGTPPVAVSWKIDGSEYDRQTKKPGSSVITFNSIRNSDGGVYTCEGFNEATDADGRPIIAKKSISVNVKSKPSVNTKASPGTVYSFVGNNQVTNIRCAFFGFPPPEVKIFDKSNKKIGNGTREAVLKLYTDKLAMFTTYRCYAKNDYGVANHTVLLKFAGSPSEPRNLYTNATCEIIRLFWDEPNDNGGMPVTQYIVGYGKDSDSEIVQNVNAPTRDFRALNLEPETTYKFSVQAFNRAHKGGATRAAVTTKEFCRPSRPVILAPRQVILEETRFTLKWRAPEEDGGDPDISYKVRYTPYLSDGDLGVTVERTTSQLEIEISDLEEGTKYKVEVVAVNLGGESDAATKEYQVTSIGARSRSCATSVSLLLMAVSAGASFVVHRLF